MSLFRAGITAIAGYLILCFITYQEDKLSQIPVLSQIPIADYRAELLLIGLILLNLLLF